MKTKLNRISKKQQQWLINHVNADCKLDSKNWDEEDHEQRCIIGSFMTNADIHKLYLIGGYRSATFTVLPEWMQNKIRKKTQLDTADLLRLQHSNDSVEAEWEADEEEAKRVIVKRQNRVMKTLLSIFKRHNRTK